MIWASRAAKNLLPLRREKSNLQTALREWRYTGNYNDLEAPEEDCELCDHPEIRYQFEIQNLHTGSRLLVGSECINRFGISATGEDGETLDAEASRRKVGRDRSQLIEEARKRRVVTALVALAHVDGEFKIESFIDYLHTRGAFTPKQLSILQWRLSKFGVAHNIADFKLTIRRNREKDQLLALEDWKLQLLWPALSPTQRQFVSDAGRQIA